LEKLEKSDLAQVLDFLRWAPRSIATTSPLADDHRRNAQFFLRENAIFHMD
jgi:hypothetical protein